MAVGGERSVECEQHQRFGECLSEQQSIERVAVPIGERCTRGGMARADGQRYEAGLFGGRGDGLGIEIDFAGLTFDGDFPDRGGAEVHVGDRDFDLHGFRQTPR